MNKIHLVRQTIALGAAVTLSLACYTLSGDVAAASFCQETDMAGLSLSLDKYYTANYADTSSVSESTQTVQTSTASKSKSADESTAKASLSKKSKTKSSTKTSSKASTKKSSVSKRFETLGISIASDYVNIRRHPTTKSKAIGRLPRGAAAQILHTRKHGWVQIKSGTVKGYIKKKYLAVGALAEKLSGKYGVKYMRVKASTVTLNVRTRTSTKADIVTQIPGDESFYVTKECGDNWVRISVDGETGYVAKEFVDVYVKFKKAISMKEIRAKRRRAAAAKRAQERRKAALAAQKAASSSSSSSSSNSSTSTSGVSGSTVGAKVASYAQKFVGNPYVYGGTSLTHGTDCSGFSMSLYAAFGYSIPRTSRAQSTYGKSVSLSNVQPGDLIFYKNGSTVGHVAVYIGGGRVCHASNHIDGIKISNMYYRQPYCARRIAG